MAAYAALGSLIHLVEHIQNYHARHLLFLEEQHMQLQSLKEKVTFLQDFLGAYFHRGSEKARDLESRIASAAYSAEDIIESHILDNIHALSPSPKNRSSTNFSHRIDKVIDVIAFIQEEVMKIEKDKLESTPVDSLRRTSSKNEPMVLFEDELMKIKDNLTGSQHSEKFHIISITGMGGIGKTTLAKQVYDNPSIMEKFDIQGWVTIPQDNNVRKILSVLLEKTGALRDESALKHLENRELGLKLHKHLSSRRYLLVLDDVWSVEAWEKVSLFFPRNEGSGVVVTSRNVYAAKGISTSTLYEIQLLDKDKSWSLFSREVFVQASCPPEFLEIGKKIVANCRGLPLSIVVIGGLLAKYKMDIQYWEYIAKGTSTAVNSADDDVCFKILLLSYNNLPAHLKSCFLYIGVYPEDHQIHVGELVKLWVAEGFVNPVDSKSFDEVGKDYLDNLIERNLVSVLIWGCTGKKKVCKIHDLLRDLCLREGLRERFLCVAEVDNPNISQKISNKRRVAIHNTISDAKYGDQAIHYSSFPRTLMCHFKLGSIPSLNSRFLRVLNVVDEISPKDTFHLINSRFLHFGANVSKFPSSVSMLWDLQTLIVKNKRMGIAPSAIWNLPQLMHLIIEAGFFLPDPPSGSALKKLETLSKVVDFRFTEEVLVKIPNVKKVKLLYLNRKDLSSVCLNNLGLMQKLHSLECEFPFNKDELARTDLLQNLEFPKSLKSLTLSHCRLDSEDMIRKITLLPNLEKLKLRLCFLGDEWDLNEWQFGSLKYMELFGSDVVSWIADDFHFPALERLVLGSLKRLKEVPSTFGDIYPLESIRMTNCSTYAANSAKEILKYRQSMENGNFRLYVDHELMRSRSRNSLFKTCSIMLVYQDLLTGLPEEVGVKTSGNEQNEENGRKEASLPR